MDVECSKDDERRKKKRKKQDTHWYCDEAMRKITHGEIWRHKRVDKTITFWFAFNCTSTPIIIIIIIVWIICWIEALRARDWYFAHDSFGCRSGLRGREQWSTYVSMMNWWINIMIMKWEKANYPKNTWPIWRCFKQLCNECIIIMIQPVNNGEGNQIEQTMYDPTRTTLWLSIVGLQFNFGILFLQKILIIIFHFFFRLMILLYVVCWQ